MGSLITAVASFCDIKQRGGRWHVRIDDIDPLRRDPKASIQIIESLKAHGLAGDEPVKHQSHRIARYKAAKDHLSAMAYYCDCSRSKLKATPVYPGYCRNRSAYQANHALRLQVDDQSRTFHDDIKGSVNFNAKERLGDFVIWRRDNLVTYHLATAVDDGEHYSHVLRGEDLYEQTLPQLYLIERLNLIAPTYAHIPILTYPDGTKLSKQTHAPALDNKVAPSNLRTAFDFLGQKPPKTPLSAKDWLDWGVKHWRLAAIPTVLKPFHHVNDPDT
jgi:glutamyl-Q tRNA(Asp) synthetase